MDIPNDDSKKIYKTVCEMIGIAVLHLDERKETSAQENIAVTLKEMLDKSHSDLFLQQCIRVAIRLMTD
ncbi:hypothetical protein [Serratia liquefaciens]|uniref:hypothetical protein n=1 Tax=Serratia liquefaciens TaxID=614 RepID=UPI001F18BBE5|nr:hypothetical protein [Serratia liquefaciens]MCE9938859.1 hypothetical protein [Serratia liquefaciens]